jgi:hypothetical protein
MTVMPTDLAEATGPPTPLIVTESLDMELMASGRPIEHLLAGSSEEYRARRKEIVRAHYRVQDPGYRTQ